MDRTRALGQPMRTLALIALALLCAACASPTYRALGRYAESADGALTFAWPASGVEGRFVGTRVTATIEDNGDNVLDLAIDGAVTQLPLDAGVREYVLFQSDQAETHTLRLTRRSEINSAPPTTIQDIALDGAWRALPERAHRIVFFGDSNSVGYGNDGADQHCPYSIEASAPWKSYATQTAQAFDADFQLNAISGRGIIRNYDGGAGHHIPQLIDAALPDHPETSWDHAQFSPELIVVNLGANDFSTTGPGDGFGPAYVAFLRAIAQRYPHAEVITAWGPTNEEPGINAVRAATESYNASAARPAHFIVLPQAASGHIFGCDWHPGADTHALMAQTLSDEITRVMGWPAQ